jgi:hypothetical protein
MKKLVAEKLEETYHEDFQKDYENLLDKVAIKSNITKNREFDEFENELMNVIEDIERKYFNEMDQEIFDYITRLLRKQNNPEIKEYLENFLDQLAFESNHGKYYKY